MGDNNDLWVNPVPGYFDLRMGSSVQVSIPSDRPLTREDVDHICLKLNDLIDTLTVIPESDSYDKGHNEGYNEGYDDGYRDRGESELR